MVDALVFSVKGIILTEALTHAVRSWGIFDPIRSRITASSDFGSRLLACFECTSVWIGAGVIAYLYFIDFRPFTFIIIFQRLATIANIVINLVDAQRAVILNKL